MKDLSVVRRLAGYERGGDLLRVEYPLPSDVKMEFLRQLFAAAADDPMYDDYAVGPEQVAGLHQLLGVELHLEQYDLFLQSFTETRS